MNAKQLSRELHRIARREVPDGETNLWPAIRSRITPATPGMSSLRNGSEGSGHRSEVSSVYVWSTDERRGRFGNGTRLLAASVAVLLVAAVMAVVLNNHGGNGRDNLPIAAVGTPTTSAAPTVEETATGFGQTTSHITNWPSDGKLSVPVATRAGMNGTASVNMQIMPTGNIRLTAFSDNSKDGLNWHVVGAQSCDAVATTSEPDLEKQDIVPSFLSSGWPELIPAEKTHQALTVVAYAQRDGLPVACASAPAVPEHFIVAYDAAPYIPRTCPVTLPTLPLFKPSGDSSDPSNPIYGDYWYGTNNLYTGLPLDGVWAGSMKVFWWSRNYGWAAEPIPALNITGERLDRTAPALTVDQATNGAGGMLTGISFPTTGCWRISGTYQSHTLSFVVWVNDLSSVQFTQAPNPTATTTPAPGPDGLTHTDQQCRATSFGPSSATPTDVNVEFRGVTSSGQFWALLYQPMPIYAQQNVQFTWKIESDAALQLTFTDSSGLQIGPTTGPDSNTSVNWPRPGKEWRTSVLFPHSGCWHAHAQAGDVTGDMWFEVFSQPVTPPAAATPAASVTPGTSNASNATCSNVSDLEPNPNFGNHGLAHAGPLWFSGFDQSQAGKAVISGFIPGFPTKILIHQETPLHDPVELSGSDCATGQQLHFCYVSNGTCGFTGQPVSEAELSQRGDPVVNILAFGDYAGYILFPRPGIYRLSVEQNGAEVGSVVVQMESQ